MKLKTSLLATAALLSIPAFAFAQNIGTVQNLFSFALGILNGYVVPLVFALAFLMFLVGIYRYYIAGGADEEKVKEGHRFLMWSIIGFVVMFSVWGLINLFLNTLGFNSSAMPAIPTFSNSTVSGGNSLTNGLGSLLNGLLGGNGSGSGSSPYGGGTNTGTVFNPSGTTNGQLNYVTASNGSCPNSSYTLVGNGCVNNAAPGASSAINGTSNSNATSGAGAGVQDVPLNGSCQHSGDCSGDNICISGSCKPQPDDTSGWGKTQDGSACTYDEQCTDNSTCSPSTHVCETTNDTGIGGANGDVPLGGQCAHNDDCSGDNLCDAGECKTPDSVDTVDDSVAPGGACTNDNQCKGDNAFCTGGICVAENGDGSTQMQDCPDGTQVPVGQTCESNTVMCDGDPAPAGSTCCDGGGYAQPGSSCPTPAADTSGSGPTSDPGSSPAIDCSPDNPSYPDC